MLHWHDQRDPSEPPLTGGIAVRHRPDVDRARSRVGVSAGSLRARRDPEQSMVDWLRITRPYRATGT